MSKLLTIAIPTYNRAAKLDKQLSWTYEAVQDEDYEFLQLVVLDNHSSDTTPTICHKWKSIFGDRISIK